MWLSFTRYAMAWKSVRKAKRSGSKRRGNSQFFMSTSNIEEARSKKINETTIARYMSRPVTPGFDESRGSKGKHAR